MINKRCAGSGHYSAVDEVFHGRIEGINDLVAFEGKSVQGLKRGLYEGCGRLYSSLQGSREGTVKIMH